MVWQPAGGGEALSAEEWEATTAGSNGSPEAEFEVVLVDAESDAQDQEGAAGAASAVEGAG
jgi:hypothetical protein